MSKIDQLARVLCGIVGGSSRGQLRSLTEYLQYSEKPQMDITTLLIIVIVVVLLGGGGWYGRGRWY